MKYFIFLCLVFILPFGVNAKENLELKVDKTELKAGDTVTVTVNLDYKDSLYAFEGKLSFDENVFEVLETANFKEQDKWSDILYNKENNKFALLNKSGEVEDHLFMVQLFVKNNPVGGETEIALKNSTASDGKKDIEFTDSSKTLKVTGTNTNNTYSKDEEEEKDINVQTFKPFITIGIILIIVLVIAIIIINSNTIRETFNIDIKNRRKITIILSIVSLILLITTIVLTIMNVRDSDVNLDNKNDYLDAKKINEYLIDITKEETLEVPKKELDVNGDGKITITDAAKKEKDTTKKTDYEVTLKNASNDKYPKKGTEVKLTFEALINPNNVKIKEVYLNNQKVKVTSNNNSYEVTVKVPNKAGVNSYTISKVVLENGREIKVKNLIYKVDVLKDEPKVLNLDYKNNNLNITLEDNDKAFKSAYLRIAKGLVKEDEFDDIDISDLETNKIIYEHELDINSENISLPVSLDLGENYSVLIQADYDLDTNELDSKSNNYQDKNMYYKTFTNGKVTIEPLEDISNLYSNQGSSVDFTFNGNVTPNTMSQIIKKVIIDGELRDVTYVDGHYSLKLENTSSYGEKRHIISAVILDDDTNVLCNYEIIYNVLKEKPTFTDFIYHDLEGKISFNLNDKDKALISAKLIVTKKGDDTPIYEHALNLNNENFDYALDLEKGYKYDIKIQGYYDLDENKENKKNDYEGSLFDYELVIHDVRLSKVLDGPYYANKDTEVELKFKADAIPDDNGSTITEVVINNVTYNPTLYNDSTYGVKVKVPNIAGIKECKLTKVRLGDDELTKDLTFKVDVLKDKPTIEDFYIEENDDKQDIIFTINDKDNALKTDASEVIIKDSLGSEVKHIKVNKGANKVDLKEIAKELLDGGTYYIDIKVNYDLDSDKENGKNEASEYLIENHEIKIYRAKLTLADNNYYFKKEETKAINIKAMLTHGEDVTIKSFVMQDGEIITASYKDNLYSINVKAPNKAGLDNYNIKEIILSNDVKISAHLEFTIDVLKDIPYLNKVNLSDDNKTLSYELVDLDSAFIDGTIAIYDANNQVLKTENLKIKGTINYEFMDSESYTIKVLGNYDLDSQKEDTNNHVTNKEMYNHTFIIGGDYNFTLSNVTITDTLKKGESPVVTFTSTNQRNAKVQKVTLNGKEYKALNTESNNYEVKILDANINPGMHEVTFDSVKLDTLKVYNNQKDYQVQTLTYSILKDAPTVTDITLTDNSNSKVINVKCKVNNPNYALTKLQIILVDSSDKIIASREIMMEEILILNSTGLDLSYDKNTDGKYKVKFLADYELGEQHHYNNQNIGEKEIFIQNKEIYIDNITLKTSKYVVKNQKNYEISYEVFVGNNIKTNNGKQYTRLSAITINGQNYIANGESSNRANIYKSKIGLKIPNKSGVLTLNANRVQLELNSYYDKVNNYYSVPTQSIQIEVLKDVPEIQNLKVKEENYQEGTVTFEFDVKLDSNAKDKDESFIDGTVSLGNVEKSIKRGHNEVKFTNIQNDANLDLVFKASYDLDTDALNTDKDENQYTNAEIYRSKYGLYDNKKYQDIKITDSKALSKNNDNYFAKNETVKLNFKITGNLEELGLTPLKVIIKDKEYSLTKLDDSYEVVYDSYNTFGEKEITIASIILSNGKEIKLTKDNVIKLEVLKDEPKITNFKYEVQNNKIKITSKLNDNDAAIVSAKIKITDENNKVILNQDYQEEITIIKNQVRYYVQVIMSYDLDNDKDDNKNYYKDIKELDEIISFDTNNIELKNINEINLYRKDVKNNENEIMLVNEISKDELSKNKNNYFVEINMEEMPSVRAMIKEVKEKDDHLILVLDYKYVSIENIETSNLEIDFGELKNNKASNETHPDIAFKSLIEKLKNNEDITLTKNYDASSIEDTGDITYVESYSGKLNGNGYTIKNLKKPLFKDVSNAEIKNITFEDVTMPATSGNGTLALTVSKSTIENIIIDKYYKPNNEGRLGTLIGNIKDSTVTGCASKDFNIYAGWNNLQQIGGLIGIAENTTIKNNYVIGKIPGGWNFRSGLVGNASNSIIENNFVKVEIGYGMGNEISYDITNGNNNTFKNNISLAYGFKHNMFSSYKESINNYYVDSKDAIDIGQTGVTKITQEDVDKDLFKNAEFNEDIWSLDNVSYDNPPIFKSEKLKSLKGSNNKDFDESKITLYNNLMRLMPFYKIDKIISIAKNVQDKDLNSKEIMHIIPVDKNGNLVNYLTTNDYKKISKLKIVYKTNEHKEYKVTYDNTYDMVVSYRIPDLKIDYNYNHYLIDDNSQVVNNLTNYLKGLDYTENLDTLTSTSDSRIYKDFYNEVTSKELKEFTLKFLSNSDYTNTLNDTGVNSYLEGLIKKDNKIEKILYMYNYLRRFYDLEIDGMKLYDFMLFNMEGFDKTLTAKRVADLYLQDGNNFKTDATGTKYGEVLGSYTNQTTIAKFLEYMVTEFGDGDLDRWTRNQFKGYLVELPVTGMEDEIQYTLWDHFSNEDANYKPHRAYDMMLPILTLPRNAAYIISTPVQYIIGAQRSYIENPDNFKEQDILRRRIQSYADRMKTYYETAYNILGDVKLFNDIHTFHLDKRFAYDENGAMVYQQVGTEEPFHKNFNEVTNRWQTSDGNAAVAWGDRIDWSAEGLLDGYIDKELAAEMNRDVQEYTYHTFTHETAHNIDARLFLKNHGRRFDAGGEDYADSNLMQSFGANDIVMNLSVYFNKGERIGSSLTPERINTPEKIWDYYNKVFQTIYVMDYIEAQAFLQLSSEDKAEIGIKVTYPNEDKYQEDGNKFRARQTSGFNQIEASEWDKMSLTSINDLIDNRIMKYAGVYKYASRGSNSYGGEGINTAHWYQPNNPDGRPDSYALKWIAYEMLGYKGYQDGYVEYYSNIHSERKVIYKNIDKPEEGTQTVDYKNDNMAIQKISEGKYQTIDEYKKARFEEVAKKLPYLKEINVKDYVQKLYEALVKDALSTRTELADKMAKNPKCLDDYWCRADVVNRRSYPNSTKVRQDIYYTLKELTNDFEGEIYDSKVLQDVSDLKVKK